MSIRVLLADDHKMIREALGALLTREPDITVVAHASNGDEAITLAQAWKPDVVLMDVCMPGTNGIDAAARISKLLPRTRVIALSAQGERIFVTQMVKVGVQGYVRKDQSMSMLVQAIRTVMAGQTWLPETTEAEDELTAQVLSRRERSVLQEIATGKRTREIADIMGISTKTVDTYRRRIMNKLGLVSQAELTKYAVLLHSMEHDA
ncbi:MAG: response regulator transcription factor [Thiohalocapsa sp. PB-PSB1]|jgi:two-component system response regulator NreC|nr:MAG: hypothetical protein N838_18530 [Thiohalocapsa sp. PB-PSB1]QQO54517.1 MAG: response regulator transcription factor [Thiohalocapsa sp. PB-PSB1]HCS89981.1 DNA-binding response regulator [Chromatiaceae bacterium]